MATPMLSRDEIPQRYRWSTEDIFTDDAQWEAAVASLRDEVAKMRAFRGRLGEGADVVLAALEQMDRVQRALSPVTLWARLCYQVQMTAPGTAVCLGRSQTIAAEANAAMAFVDPELIEIGFDTLDQWVAAEPGLADHRRRFDRLKQRKAHVGSPEVERLLSMTDDSFETVVATHSVLVNADIRFQDARDAVGQRHEVMPGRIDALVGDSDRVLRRTAWESYHDGYLQCRNTLAGLVSAGIKQLVFQSRARGYGSTLEAAMHQDELPVEVHDSLIQTFRQHLPRWHRYWRLRRQALGYRQLHGYDLTAPLSDGAPDVPYEQAVQWICEGMRPLGEAYVSVLRRACGQERWVDVFPCRDKRMGAFATSGAVKHPYVLVNYDGSLNSVSTLAHELGHAMHSYYTRENQRLQDCTKYGHFLGETASNFAQAMVRHHLYTNETDPRMRLAIAEEAMSNFHRYLFIMPILSQLELRLHQQVERGQAVTADLMIDWMADLFEEGFGGEVIVDRPRLGTTWAAFPAHICRNFYAFKYATGIAAGNALAARVLEHGEAATADYLAYLAAGGSCSPLETLHRAGVDMRLPEPTAAVFDVMNLWLDRLESLLPEVVPD